ncbi:MAG: peptidase [Paracoccus sp. (in: a-proteobacteria)]|jgi:NlpC/P60 family putative phage cell wall peptidase|uniref:peptidase n=1 Tax=unclassified Paracoccus (in: a-proteobacteria) TaxID=2688777 RepID=UPI000C577A7D|nr:MULTISPECIES: peptidase [unclassified Paracoccus (in: a-proteobacteria)]MAN57082.1 peptidase [Paracoccus sp. (in: a-proteobacteria)]MBA48775.1 peptidase [Paracoccus sp. (in: a-proteobacteria)]MCS5603333.1 peptidase [Paracoccus sp. (in: a-proteobacteria)]MDB2490354.1 peptidase [Paracoccus sp. (in: a-proteobacteria)]MDB2551300.1 peptidase [Paracoccus sp. (in: a-proteobacteria)]|tara:strand:+ start:4153 stop:4581 length:429 start_codon:yes stop_codon:yes gene_type:complete
MTDRAVSVARDWLGTPYIHQASQKGVASDCLGLIRGIWRELYGEEPEAAPDYTPDWGEFGSHELLMDGAMRHMLAVERAAALAPGQVLLFRMRAGAVAKHLGIVSAAGDAPRFIHAYTHHGVIDSPLTAPWRNRIAARFRFP